MHVLKVFLVVFKNNPLPIHMGFFSFLPITVVLLLWMTSPFRRHGENAIPIENNTPHDKIHALQQDPKKRVCIMTLSLYLIHCKLGSVSATVCYLMNFVFQTSQLPLTNSE